MSSGLRWGCSQECNGEILIITLDTREWLCPTSSN